MDDNSPHRQERKRQRRRRRWTRAPTSPMNLGAATATAMLLLLSSSGSCASATTVNSHDSGPHGNGAGHGSGGHKKQQGMSPNPSRNLPQHRVRSTRCMVDYGLNHPWNEFGNLHGIHYDMNAGFTIRDGMDLPFMSNDNTHENGDASKNGEDMEEGGEEEDAEAAWQRQRQRRLLRNEVLREFLPKSQMRSWSAQSTIVNTETLMPDSNGSTTSGDTPNTDILNTHENIRIKASIIEHDSSGYAYLYPNERSILLRSIIQPMLNTWSKALKVVPIQPTTPLTIDSYQLYDGKTCGPGMDSGLPSVLVPLDHMVDGIVDTDLMVYVSVGFHGRGASRRRQTRQRDDNYDRRRAQAQDGNNRDLMKEDSTSSSVEHTSLQGQDSLVSSPFFTKLRGQHTNYTSYGNQAEEYIDTEIDMDMDTDTDAYVDEESLNDHTDAVPTCSGSYLASATYCSTDQYDRPIAGMLHLCIGPDFFNDVSQKELYRRTVLHELGHVLGFNAQSLAHFRNETTGEPLTPRDGNGDVVDRWVQCAGPVGSGSESEDEDGNAIVSETTGLGDEDNSGTAEDLELDSGEDTITDSGLLHGEGERYLRNRRPDSRSRNRRRAFIPLPSKDILQFRNDVRGGVRVAQVVTPTVKQVARNHFDCQTLDGAELESGLSTLDIHMGGSGDEHSSVTDPDMESSIYDVEVDMDIIMNENTDTEDEPNNEDETIDNYTIGLILYPSFCCLLR